MTRTLAALSALAAALAVSAPTLAEELDAPLRSVKVSVVDVGGGRAFLAPGAAGGLEEGTAVVLERQRLKVAAVSSSYAVVELEGRVPALGAEGVALVREKADREADAPRRGTPTPLEQFRDQWLAPTLPASTQAPVPVPLGRVRPRRVHLSVSLGTGANVGLGGRPTTVDGNLRARLLAEPLVGVPLRVEADVEGQFWWAEDIDLRRGDESRPWVDVRALQLSYGEERGFYAALGRLRYAASTLGMLDGLRIQSPSLRGFTVGAFGGLVPDPFTGVTEWDVGRFGVEVAYQAPSSSLRPMASLVAHGSVFEGAIDERRISLDVGLYPGSSRVGAHLETSFNDADNPWNMPVAELSAAGLDGSYRVAWFEIGARFDMRRPERSRWLDSTLPPSFLCTAAATNTGARAPCAGDDDTRYFGSLDASARFDRGSVGLGATVLHFAEHDGLDQVGGVVQGQLDQLFGFGRAGLSFVVSQGSLVDSYAGRLTLGGSFRRGLLDVSLHYRVSYSRYEADLEGWVGHLFGGALLVHPAADLYFSVQADGVVGRDVDSILVRVYATWSPSF
jgi:hypothetical protein